MLERIFSRVERALVLGIGGGGDVIGGIPTAGFLRFLGCDVLLGGITWERKVADPKPGPRRIEELEGVERINEFCAIAKPGARIKGGCILTEGAVAEILGEDVFLLDINGGAVNTLRALEDASEKLGVDLVVGIDVGGDSLARGNEKGVSSPLADSIMLAVLSRIPGAIVGMIGYGSDGELTLEEIHTSIAEIIKSGGYIGARGASPEELELMEKCAEATPTEASKLVVEAGKGKCGRVKIRQDSREVHLTPCSLVTFYFRAREVFKVSKTARLVENTSSLREADRILRSSGYRTELFFEEEFWKYQFSKNV